MMTGTDGRRIYAVGDIHGCLDKLDAMLARIEADLAAAPHPAPRLVFLGDYVDRGPDSRGVIDRLSALPGDVVCLRGNHDEIFLDYLRTGEPLGWLGVNMGGSATLRSYGVDPAASDVPPRLRAAVPEAHVRFLEATAYMHRVGGYVFVHAGITPGVPLDAQDPDALIWIRGAFLDHPGPHPAVVVHGHTPVDRVRHHGHRIEVDTGACFGGPLSCVVLEGAEAWLLAPGGRVSL